MIKNYFKIAWRNLLKNKVYSFINIFGLALGIAVTIMIGLWVHDELSYNDYFQDQDQIAQVWQQMTFNGETSTGTAMPRPLEKVLRDEYNDYFDLIVMSTWNNSRYLKYGETNISQVGNFMQKDAPELLELKILKGAKEGLKEINSIMLSASCAKALFGNEEPIGKIVKMNNQHDMAVTAIYEDLPRNNSNNDIKFISPWDHLVSTQEWIKQSADNWGNNSFQLFVKIGKNTSFDKINQAIKDIKKEKDPEQVEYNPSFFLLPMKDWYLRSNFRNGIQTGGRIEYVWLFAVIGIFVLILACINFMNLSTARSEKRAKEVGIRKSIGSNRSQLIRQFLSESLLIACFSFLLGIIMVILFLGKFNDLASKEISFPWGSPGFWLISVLLIICTALLAGSYPALYLSSFKPIKVLKGTFRAGRFSSVPRKVLVVVQFTVSVALIIGTLIVMKQIKHTKDRPAGYDKSNLIQIPVMSDDFTGKYDMMRNEFINSGGAIEMSSSSSPTTQTWSNRNGYRWEGKPEDFQEDFAWVEISHEYAKSLNLQFVQGRDFSREFSTDSTAVIINRTAAEYMGLTDPIGKYITDDDIEDPDPPLKIIGVVEDMIIDSPYRPVKQTLYVFDRHGNKSYYNLKLNPQKSTRENLNIVENVFKKHFPHLPFQYEFVDERYARKFAAEERIASLASVFTILAILISCLGLFGLASFVAEQKTKEIGIRKVLGATVSRLWMMLSKDFIYLVLISLLIAIPIAYFFMHEWLQNYTYRTDLSWWVFIMAGLGALLITLATVSFQAIKAAISNPTKSLRSE